MNGLGMMNVTSEPGGIKSDQMDPEIQMKKRDIQTDRQTYSLADSPIYRISIAD